MRVLGAMIAGAIASVVGAVIWIVVGYYGNVEIGWIAWGVGVLAGFGVFLGSGRRGDLALGILAVMLALTGILIGKFGVAYAAITSYAESDDPYVAGFAEEAIYERNRNGESWPVSDGWADDLSSIESEYPATIWAQARSQWQALSEMERDEIRRMPNLINRQFHIVYLSDQLVREYMQAGKPVAWPPGMSSEFAFREEDYPRDLWADAISRWNAMSASEQQGYRAAMIAVESQRSAEDKALWQADTTLGAFKASFSPFDGLWALLAILSAFKLGAATEEHSADAA